jgi:hypothetical protein
MLFEWPTRLRLSAYRSRYGITLFLALIASFVGTGRCPAATAMGSPDLNGIWKLVVHSPGDDQEWVIIEIKQADGRSIVEMVDKPKLFGKPQIYLEKSPDGLVVLIADGQTDITFHQSDHASISPSYPRP